MVRVTASPGGDPAGVERGISMKYSNEDEVFETVATDRDPRERGASVVYRDVNLNRTEAAHLARTYASHGHFATVYAPDGEAVIELKGE